MILQGSSLYKYVYPTKMFPSFLNSDSSNDVNPTFRMFAIQLTSSIQYLLYKNTIRVYAKSMFDTLISSDLNILFSKERMMLGIAGCDNRMFSDIHIRYMKIIDSSINETRNYIVKHCGLNDDDVKTTLTHIFNIKNEATILQQDEMYEFYLEDISEIILNYVNQADELLYDVCLIKLAYPLSYIPINTSEYMFIDNSMFTSIILDFISKIEESIRVRGVNCARSVAGSFNCVYNYSIFGSINRYNIYRSNPFSKELLQSQIDNSVHQFLNS